MEEFFSHPATIAIISAGGAAGLNYVVNRSRIKADTESIVASTYQKLLKDLNDQLDRLRERVEELEIKLKESQHNLEDAIKEKQTLLEEIRKIRKRNEDLLKENNALLKRSDEMMIHNSDLMRENNRLQSKIIELENQIKSILNKK